MFSHYTNNDKKLNDIIIHNDNQHIISTTSISLIMSADNTNQASEVTKKTKAPSLPEKYNKFIQFGYYMMSLMSNQESFNRDEYMEQLKMFATVEDQQSFVQNFFDNQKQIKKDITLLKKSRNKKPAVEKPKRTTKPKGKAKQTQSETPTEPAVVEETQENLIETITNELTEEPMITQITSAIEVAKELTAKKPRVVKKKTAKKTDVVDELASELASVKK